MDQVCLYTGANIFILRKLPLCKCVYDPKLRIGVSISFVAHYFEYVSVTCCNELYERCSLYNHSDDHVFVMQF